MKLTVSSENQIIPVEFKGRISITFDHGSSAENFLFTPEMVRSALIKYTNQIDDLKRMSDLVRKETGVDISKYKYEDATPYQLCPKCNGEGWTWMASSTAQQPCTVCNGNKIILMHKP